MTISPIFDQLARKPRSSARPVDPRETPLYASLTTAPLEVDDLTADEREIIAEMGDTVARLILQMLDDDTRSTRRWPFHAVR